MGRKAGGPNDVEDASSVQQTSAAGVVGMPCGVAPMMVGIPGMMASCTPTFGGAGPLMAMPGMSSMMANAAPMMVAMPGMPGMSCVPGMTGIPTVHGMSPMMMGMPGLSPMMMMGPMGPMMMGMQPGMQTGMSAGVVLGQQPVARQPASAASTASQLAATPSADQTPIDPRVREVCRSFGIEHLAKKLHDAMRTREDYDEDIQALALVMEKSQAAGKKSSDVMLIKIREIERGVFAGKDLLDPEMQAFTAKYELDDRVFNRLIETKRLRQGTWRLDLRDIDVRLATAKRPAGLLVRLIEDLQERGRLSSPPRSLGLPQPSSSHRSHADARDFDRERGGGHHQRGGQRSRSRERRR